MEVKAFAIYVNLSENEKKLVGHAIPFCDGGEIFYDVTHYTMFEECFYSKDFEVFKKEKEEHYHWTFVEILNNCA